MGFFICLFFERVRNCGEGKKNNGFGFVYCWFFGGFFVFLIKANKIRIYSPTFRRGHGHSAMEKTQVNFNRLGVPAEL